MRRAIPGTLAAALLAIGCGGDDDGSNPGGDAAGGDDPDSGACSDADCPAAPPAPAPDGKQWVLAFREEFDGDDYDHDKLTPCFDWNVGDCTSSFNNGREHYQPEQIQVAGGAASMIAEPLDPPYASDACLDGSCTYAAGLLSTARPRADDGSDYLYSFTYGYLEARVKFPATQGFFTAFWMLPTATDYNYRTEIDIVEILGHDPTTIFMTYHYSDRSQSFAVNDGVGNNGDCEVKDYSQDWVRFGIDWQPDHVAWYIDGVKCAQFDGDPGSEIEDGPMQLILNNMVDNNWIRDWDVATTDQTQSDQMDVDYIRVHQLQ
jgi:hypothetical protein